MTSRVGAVTPDDSRLARNVRHKFEGLVAVFFLSAFTGKRTPVGFPGSLRDWLFCLLNIAVASPG